jgi:hypothetical protein
MPILGMRESANSAEDGEDFKTLSHGAAISGIRRNPQPSAIPFCNLTLIGFPEEPPTHVPVPTK